MVHWAALVGDKDFVKAGLAQNIPVDCVAKNKQTPLMWAILRGEVPVARALLEAKAPRSRQPRNREDLQGIFKEFCSF